MLKSEKTIVHISIIIKKYSEGGQICYFEIPFPFFIENLEKNIPFYYIRYLKLESAPDIVNLIA